MKVYDILLLNEGQERLTYDIAAESPEVALQEAWRQYREQPFWDGENPPAWTRPKVGDANMRDGQRPYVDEQGYVMFGAHCISPTLRAAIDIVSAEYAR